jgi:predicted amidohydrolase
MVRPAFSPRSICTWAWSLKVTSQTIADDYRGFLANQLDEIVDGLKLLAATHDVVLLGGSHNRIADDGSLRNTAYLVFPDGRVETQDKIHLTPPEHSMGTIGGDDLLVTQIGPFTAGILICADVQFPELSRYLVSQGVNLLLCPSLTWNRRGIHRVMTGCAARAIENQAYVVMSPLFGTDGLPSDAPMYAVGQAAITAPVDRTFGLNDGIVAKAETKDEQIIYATLDLDLINASRERPEAPGLKLQRPDVYATLNQRMTDARH